MIHPARLLQRLFYGISKCYWGMRFSDGSPATSVADALSMFCFSEVFQDNEASVAAGAQWANDHVMGTTASVEKGDADDIPITAIPDGGLDNLMRLIERLDPSLDDQVRTALSNHPDAVDTLRRWGYVQEEEAHEALLPKPKDKEELQ